MLEAQARLNPRGNKLLTWLTARYPIRETVYARRRGNGDKNPTLAPSPPNHLTAGFKFASVLTSRISSNRAQLFDRAKWRDLQVICFRSRG